MSPRVIFIMGFFVGGMFMKLLVELDKFLARKIAEGREKTDAR